MKEAGKTCMFCQHFVWNEGTKGYSEWTPGSSPSVYCLKEHWEFDPEEDGANDLRKCMTSADTCPDYVLHRQLLLLTE